MAPETVRSCGDGQRAGSDPASCAEVSPTLGQHCRNRAVVKLSLEGSAGSDYHDQSIEIARKRAAEAGVADRVRFEVAPAAGFSGTGYDLAATFDCLHDMGDPVAAARHIRQALKPDGTWLVVEPYAVDEVGGNLNPVGRVYYNASTMLCVPNALSQPGGYALGAQAGESAIHQVVTQAGFTRFRHAAETPFNLVYEVRP